MSSLREGQRRVGAISGLLVALAWLGCGPTGVRHVVPVKVLPDADAPEGGSGGDPGTGGRPGTGGKPGTGGSPATGGSPGTGGSPATGGSPGTGGSPATGGMGGSVPPDAAPDLAPDTAPETCVSGMPGGFMNTPMPSKAGTFTVRFSASASAAPSNGIVALSMGPATGFAGYAAAARFNPMGMIDAVNGGAYEAASAIAYTASATYQFRFTVNVTAHTYSAYVTPPSGAETMLGSNLSFRTGTTTVTRLDSWGVAMQSMATGTIKACGFTVE
jgi:hypothetical protein